MATWDTVEILSVNSALRWDAEYYVNPYNEFLGRLFSRPTNWSSLSDASEKLTSGHTPYRHDVSEGDTPFITVECVDALSLNLNKAKRIWKYQAQGELARVCVQRGDLLITIKRRIGLSTPILDNPGLMAVNQDVVVMTPKAYFRPGYVAAVMNSRIGQYQALRSATEQMNPYINVTTLAEIRIPILSDHIQKQIEACVSERLKLVEQSSDDYDAAEKELLDRVGWKKLKARMVELDYVRDFDELAAAGRSDAEFFQPQYSRLRRVLSQRGSATVNTFCPKPSRGTQPLIDEHGGVLVIDSKAVRPYGVEPSAADRVSKAFYDSPSSERARVRHDDVLLNSTGRGTLGRAGWYQLDRPALCDNHVTILRPHPDVCNPIYLSLFLNSPAGRAQSEQFQTGSSGQLEIYPQHIQQFLVYLPQQNNGFVDLAWQKRLAAKVEGASRARVTANEKLEEAKRLVEDAIARD